MRKIFFLLLVIPLLLGSCGTYTGEGAFVGSQIGAIVGSAIGGINGGPRGADVGTLVGMASGAVVGAAVGNAADRAQQERYARYQEQRDIAYRDPQYSRSGHTYGSQQYSSADESGFDPNNGGDDRIEFESSSSPSPVPQYQVRSTVSPTTVTSESVTLDQLASLREKYTIRYNSLVEICNASFVDNDGDGRLKAGEESRVSFDVMNRSERPIFGVTPTVIETTGCKHVFVSPSVKVERIEPGNGIRYTATVKAGKRLKDGEIVIQVAVAQGDNEITSQIKEFRIPTIRGKR
ncbi:MAG: hypothetical protein ACI4BA_08580 [Prevotella sp.]